MGNREPKNEIIIYTGDGGQPAVLVRIEGETVWLNQAEIAELFDVQRPAITKHLQNIFETRELEEESVSSILEHTAADGKSYKTKFLGVNNLAQRGDTIPSYAIM